MEYGNRCTLSLREEPSDSDSDSPVNPEKGPADVPLSFSRSAQHSGKLTGLTNLRVLYNLEYEILGFPGPVFLDCQ